MNWSVHLTRKANKQLIKLPHKIQDLAYAAINDLVADGIAPQGWHTRKTGENGYRLRLNYRMRYRVIAEQMVEIEIFMSDTDKRHTDESNRNYPPRFG